MTIATFEGSGGPADVQALRCFRQLSDFLDDHGQRLSTARLLTVEVTDRRSLAAVAAARGRVFGNRKPSVVSSRLARLPPGELVRVTVTTESGEVT